MGRADGSDGQQDAAPEALFCAHCGTDINPKKDEYIKVNCTIDTCRQNYHVECMTEFLLARAAQLDSWRSREKYENSAKKRPAMLLLQHWKCPRAYVAPGVKAEQPCNGFTLSGDMIKPAKNIVPPPPATAPRAAAQKKQQLPRLHPTKKPVVKQLSGSTHFTAHVPTPASGLGGSRGLLGDPLGVGAGGGGAKTFAQEQEEARKAAEKKRRRKGSASAAAGAATASDASPAGGTTLDRPISTASSTPSAETLPVPVTPAVDPARHAICISSLTDMGFGWRDAEAAADAAGGELETALHLLTAGAVGSRSGGGWADDSAPGTLGLDSYSDWHAPADASQAGSWDWGASCGSLKAHASDWGQQFAAAPSVPAAATQEADATWQHYVPPPEDRGVADDAELDELMAMLGLAC